MPSYTVVQNLLQQVQIPKDGISSHTIHHDDRIKVVVLGFAGGQELSYSLSEPAILEVLKGDARVTLDGEENELSGGSWVQMEAGLPHAIYARSDVIMLLTTLSGAQTS